MPGENPISRTQHALIAWIKRGREVQCRCVVGVWGGVLRYLQSRWEEWKGKKFKKEWGGGSGWKRRRKVKGEVRKPTHTYAYIHIHTHTHTYVHTSARVHIKITSVNLPVFAHFVLFCPIKKRSFNLSCVFDLCWTNNQCTVFSAGVTCRWSHLRFCTNG